MHIQKKYIENTKNLCCGISYEVKLLLDVSCITTDPIVIIPIKPIDRITPPIIITFLLCLPECKKNNVIPVRIFLEPVNISTVASFLILLLVNFLVNIIFL